MTSSAIDIGPFLLMMVTTPLITELPVLILLSSSLYGSFLFYFIYFSVPYFGLACDHGNSFLCLVCVFSSHPFWTSSSLDVPAGVTQEEGHTGFLIHLPSAVCLEE